MNLVDQAALNGLNAALVQLIGLPDVVPTLVSARFLPVGLGALVGMSQDPERFDQLLGRRIDAEISLLASGATPEETRAKAGVITSALLAADRAVARRRGLLKWELRKRGLARELGESPLGPQEIELRFTVLYEYVHQPTDSAERIPGIDLTILGPGVSPVVQINAP